MVCKNETIPKGMKNENLFFLPSDPQISKLSPKVATVNSFLYTGPVENKQQIHILSKILHKCFTPFCTLLVPLNGVSRRLFCILMAAVFGHMITCYLLFFHLA